jgi:organic radical activating enzyme
MENDASTAKRGEDNLFLDKDKLEDISNSVNFKEIRRKMLKNEFPSECKTCYYYEKNKIFSKRMESNHKFSHLIEEVKRHVIEDGTLTELNYKYIELRLGTVCNLKCVTCNPFSSNRWNEDVSVFKDTPFEKSYFKCDIRTEWFRSQTFYDELLTKCEGLEEVWINGGEPTLIKEHAYFLEKLIEMDKAKEVNLHYSINMTSIPDRFIEIWRQFKHVRLHLSIDDLFERNDYVRYGSKWDNIHSNFLKIIEYRDIFRLEVCQTLSALNVSNIDNFKKFYDDYGMIIAHNYVHHPTFLHVSTIPSEMKDNIMSNIQYLREDERLRLEAELFKEVDEKEVDKFYGYITLLDAKRKVSIGDYLNEWKDYFNG